MVARITYGKNIVGVLEYNKLKVDKETAGVLCCHKLPVVPLDGKIDFRALAELRYPILMKNTKWYKGAEDDNRSALSCRPQKYGCRTLDSYRPSVLGERCLTGEEVCGYLHIPPPEHCRPCATRGRFPIPSSAGGYSSIPKRGYAKHSAKITGLPKARSKTTDGPDTIEPGRRRHFVRGVPVLCVFCPPSNDNYFTFALF